MTRRFDAVVIGAGPAGSAAALRLAEAGASVLLAERKRFPRDKACGGGLTARALREAPCDVMPVVEDTVTRVELRAGRRATRRVSGQPLVLMTQRRNLDKHLAEQAADRGAEFRDGVRAEAGEGTTVRVGGETVEADVVIAAHGANGTFARRFVGGVVHGVALEGNAPYPSEGLRGGVVLEFATVPGGYGWIFPKGDHVNVGVGGWGTEGPRLREHLERLCARHGIALGSLTDVRGHRLPMRSVVEGLHDGRVAAVGDAAGLVDPLSGDGMYEAFLSARLASETALEILDGRAGSFAAYPARLAAHHSRWLAASWKAKRVVERYPKLVVALAPLLWPVVEQLYTGELSSPGEARGPVRVALRGLALLGR
jgi:geranylgeranyl reductase family protein